MTKSSWGKPAQKIIIEVQAKKREGWRYWAARALILIAAKLLDSNIVSRQTIPVLEAE